MHRRYGFAFAGDYQIKETEIGIYVERKTVCCHPTRDVYADGVMYRFGYSREEAEANEFAATFLMPEADFRQQVKELQRDGKVDLDLLAAHFGVSKEAARLRGCYLGIFSWSR